MFFKRHKSAVLLVSLVLAYILNGAKTPLTFLPIFFLITGLYLHGTRTWRADNVSLRLIAPFALFFAWCWLGLLSGAAEDKFLFIYSRYFLYAIAALFVCQFADESFASGFKTFIVTAGMFEALLILAALARGVDPQTSGLLLNSLHSGLLLSAAGAVALAHCFDPRLARKRFYWRVVVAVVLVVFLLTKSRSGILSLGFVFLFLSPRTALKMGLAAIVLAAGAYFANKNYFLTRFELDALTLPGTLGRVGIWKAAVDGIAAKPLTGWGLGNFETVYALFRGPSGEYLRYGKSTVFAHNGIMQTACDAGIPGVLFLLAGLGGILWKGRANLTGERALLSILISFFVTSLFNYSLALPLNGLIFCIAFALIAKKTLAGTPSLDMKKYFWGTAVFSSALALFLSSYAFSAYFEKRGQIEKATRACPLRADLWYALALENAGQNGSALPYIDTALSKYDQDGFVWHRRALVLIREQPANSAAIDAAFQRAQKLSPTHAPFYIEEGFYRLGESNVARARLLFEKAAALEPRTPLPFYALSIAVSKEGNKPLADEMLDKALMLKRDQLERENDPVNGPVYRELFGSNYGRFLFNLPNDAGIAQKAR